MPNAIVPIGAHTSAAEVTPPAGSVRKASYGYGVSPRDAIETTGPKKPITRLPKKPEVDSKPAPQRSRTWDKIANVGRKTAWGAAAAITAGTGIFAAGAAAGGTTAAIIGGSIFATLLFPAVAIGAVGLAAWGAGKLANRGKPPPPVETASEPEKPKGVWGKIKRFGSKLAKGGALATVGGIAAGLAAPLALTPLLFGAAAFVAAPIAAAGAVAWAAGEILD